MSSSHDITLTPQEQALIMRLKSFRVPEMAHILEEQLKDPNADLNTFLVIIPGLFEPPVRTLRATIPENESHIFR